MFSLSLVHFPNKKDIYRFGGWIFLKLQVEWKEQEKGPLNNAIKTNNMNQLYRISKWASRSKHPFLLPEYKQQCPGLTFIVRAFKCP
jgi:hypothetical protein